MKKNIYLFFVVASNTVIFATENLKISLALSLRRLVDTATVESGDTCRTSISQRVLDEKRTTQQKAIFYSLMQYSHYRTHCGSG